MSPSSRRAWIEIRTRASWRRTFSSPSSRRAWIEIRLRGSFRSPAWVALLAEGVDRNHKGCSHARQSRVALLAEGVDRNSKGHRASRLIDRSPSSRRAWIEIWLSWFASAAMLVALLAEGVDRNFFRFLCRSQDDPSPSSRRAWIEISGRLPQTPPGGRRPPRGGRG